MFTTLTPTVAYFSMEIGLAPDIPTYSGGLGVLAGDTVRAAADLGVPLVAMTLLHRKGYFHQTLDTMGHQFESPYLWTPSDVLKPVTQCVSVLLEGRAVSLTAWKYDVTGLTGHGVPVYFLDANLPENTESDRHLTDHLYGGDNYYRLCQEILLGFGGIAMLRALGYDAVATYHMNEGHSAFLTIALLEEHLDKKGLTIPSDVDCDVIRRSCVFTTHTPVPAGHDQFPFPQVVAALGEPRSRLIACLRDSVEEPLNMTHLALSLSRYVNGVAMRHGEVSRLMFPHYLIDAITNGVHATTWTCPAMARLFDHYIPGWRRDNFYLRYAIGIPLADIANAHDNAKLELFSLIRDRTGRILDPAVFTIGFARRATAYKRADLLFSDVEWLRHIAHTVGPIQIVYGGKAHPHDHDGKALIHRIFEMARRLENDIPIVYLPEYDMALAKTLCAGVDLWLNTPQKPQEASGTSGMKAALNGVPSLSVLDGWWIEGHIEGVTGWSIAEPWDGDLSQGDEVRSLYHKLATEILPLYYQHPREFAAVCRTTIAINGSFFNAERMVLQYVKNAYRMDEVPRRPADDTKFE